MNLILPKEPSHPGVSRAIVICSGKFDDSGITELHGVTRDHERMTAALRDPALGFDVRELLHPGLVQARAAIAGVCRSAAEGDVILFYYSGSALRSDDGTLHLPMRDTSKELQDATALDAAFILHELQRSRSKKIVLMLDTCWAGSFFHGNRGIPDGLFAITSSSADEAVPDLPSGGAFTTAVLEALRHPTTDRDGDGHITVDDVHEWVRAKLAKDGVRQTPQKWAWNVREPIRLASAPPRVFLSYCRENVELAKLLKQSLEGAGLEVWIDLDRVVQGNWKDRVTAGVERARAVVLLLTPAAFVSDAVRKEVSFAENKKVPIIPITIGKVEQGDLPGWYLYDHEALHRHEISPEPRPAEIEGIVRAVRSSRAFP